MHSEHGETIEALGKPVTIEIEDTENCTCDICGSGERDEYFTATYFMDADRINEETTHEETECGLCRKGQEKRNKERDKGRFNVRLD